MPERVTTCPECHTGSLSLQRVTLTGTRNDEEFLVNVSGVACDQCGYQTVLNSQSGELTRAVSDAYRRKHALLTGEEIRDLRTRLSMSQVEFADYLGVGSASVKRWESGQIQDKAMDTLIRLKAQPEQALSNYQALEARLPENCGNTVVLFVDEDVELTTFSGMRYNTPKLDWHMETLYGSEANELLKETIAA